MRLRGNISLPLWEDSILSLPIKQTEKRTVEAPGRNAAEKANVQRLF
jgi:hypothetical protein